MKINITTITITKGMQMIIASFLVVCFSFSHSPAQVRDENQENSEKLSELRRQIEQASEKSKQLEEQAKAVREEVAEIQQELINSAADIQKTEDDIIKGEGNLKELKAREQDLEQRLDKKKFEMASTLGAMQRLSMQKTNVVAFKPGAAIDTLRTTSLLKVILPDLKNRALSLEVDLTELNEIRYDINEQNILLKNQLTKLVISNSEIDELLKRRVERQKTIEVSSRQEREKLKEFAKNAKTLQDLIDQIEKEIALRDEAAKRAESLLREKPSSQKETVTASGATIPMPKSNFANSKGNLPLPARGTIDQTFNQLMATGQRSKGITITTRVGATVIAPHDGRVVFAGKFRTYGELLILSHGEGYHTLLAGMENINSIVGQWVLKGEPVGQMAASLGTSNSRQKLYVELRQKGKPVNPLPWIIAMDRAN